VAGLVKEGFLQQNALDPIDTFCSPEKQMLLGALIIGAYHRGQRLIARGVPCAALLKLSSLRRLKSARTEVPNDRPDLLERLREELDRQLTEAGDAHASVQGDQ
jgi:V/A-type H+-transporting ATPase subunit A|tara:strand:- start:13100 stop:13411 length:312 start_codon:yes stop_codon:yes gene_type:complete